MINLVGKAHYVNRIYDELEGHLVVYIEKEDLHKPDFYLYPVGNADTDSQKEAYDNSVL